MLFFTFLAQREKKLQRRLQLLSAVGLPEKERFVRSFSSEVEEK